MAGRVAAREFHERMKFSQDAANELIDQEGLDSIEELVDLTPHCIQRIVDRLVKPGGVDPTTGDPNRGFRVPERATTNLTNASTLAKMRKRTQRNKSLVDITTRDQLAMARRQRELEEGHKNDKAIIPSTPTSRSRTATSTRFSRRSSSVATSSATLVGSLLGWLFAIGSSPRRTLLTPQLTTSTTMPR